MGWDGMSGCMMGIIVIVIIYLTCDGETVRFICALNDTSDALHGMHDLCELVRAQVRETRNGARRTYEHVCKESICSLSRV